MTEPDSGVAATGPKKTTAEIKKTAYNDNWFDRLAIDHLSQSVQATTGSDLQLRKPISDHRKLIMLRE